MTIRTSHIPVLLEEVIAALSPRPGGVIVDATFGAGGYTRALLDAGATVHAFDHDPDAIASGGSWLETRENPPRLVLHPCRFSEMVTALTDAGVAQVDGVAMDIGVSSMQLDQADRGFAFSADGPLDMRMVQEGESAADFLNSAEASEIADVLYRYGEERQSRRVARAIVTARALETMGDLARVVRKALGYRAGVPKDRTTRSFQAIRIHVNAERGFTFLAYGPLYMRLGHNCESAIDCTGRANEGAIADVLCEYGNERQSRRAARASLAARGSKFVVNLIRPEITKLNELKDAAAVLLQRTADWTAVAAVNRLVSYVRLLLGTQRCVAHDLDSGGLRPLVGGGFQ